MPFNGDGQADRQRRRYLIFGLVILAVMMVFIILTWAVGPMLISEAELTKTLEQEGFSVKILLLYLIQMLLSVIFLIGPVAIAMLSVLWGPVLLLIILAGLMVSGFLAEGYATLLLILNTGLLGLFLWFSARKKISAVKAAAAMFCISGFFQMLMNYRAYFIEKRWPLFAHDSFESFSGMIKLVMSSNGSLESLKIDQIDFLFHTVLPLIYYLEPAIAAVLLLIQMMVIYIISRALARSGPLDLSPVPPFGDWKIPDYWTWVFLGSVILFLLENDTGIGIVLGLLGANLMAFAGILFFIQGLAIIRAVLTARLRALSGLVQIMVFTAIAFTYYLWPIVTALGLFDIWLKVRENKKIMKGSNDENYSS
jgi:predicted membrane protein DUF2232